MMAEKNNAPQVGSQAGAAEMQPDCSTLADDLRFAAQALGIGELFRGFTAREALLSAAGSAMLVAGIIGLLLIG